MAAESTGKAAAASRELVLECSTISKFADVVIGALMTEAGSSSVRTPSPLSFDQNAARPETPDMEQT